MSYLGVVTAVTPVLMVRGDASTTPDPATNSGGYALAVGSRVVLDVVGKQVFVFGVVGAVSVPTGCTMTWWTLTAPTGWKIMDGLPWLIASYPALAALWGQSFPGGNGTTTFGTPPVPGRSVVARDLAQAEFDTLGEVGGAKTVTLTDAQMPSHAHTLGTHTHSGAVHNGSTATYSHVGASGSWNFSSMGGMGGAASTIGSAGSDSAHNNLGPYVVCQLIVKT